MRNRSQLLPILLLLTLFVSIALAYAVVNPPFEATDEIRHYRFVRSVVENKRLPVQGAEVCRSQSHHPPLYYVTAALLTGWIDTGKGLCEQPEENPFWAYRFADVGTDNKNQFLFDARASWEGEQWAVFLARVVNIGFGAITVLLTWLIGRKITPHRPQIALIAAAIVAFNPMFDYMAAAINNDVVAAMSSALVLYLCVRLNHDRNGLSWRWGVWLGGAFGLALLSKLNNAALLSVISAEMLLIAIRHKQWKQWVLANLSFVGVSALLAGWWFVRNQRLYGEPTGVRILTELWGVRKPADSVGLAVSELPQLWSSMWGRFGFGQIPMPSVIYSVLLVLVVVGLLLALWAGAEQIKQKAWLAVVDYGLLLIFVAMFTTVTFYYMLISPAGAMGRFFFPGFPALAVLLALGFGRIFSPLRVARSGDQSQPSIPPKNHDTANTVYRESDFPIRSALISLPMLILTLYALFAILRPAYAIPTMQTGALVGDEVATVAGVGQLRDWRVSAETVTAGSAVTLELDWQVTEKPSQHYILFVHLRDEAGFVTQRDTHTGTGSFPTGFWRVGDRFTDKITLHIPELAYATDSAELSIGFYSPATGQRRQITDQNGVLPDGVLPLTTLTIHKNASPPVQHFANQLELRDYGYNQRTLATDGVLTVTLQWGVVADIAADYEIQLLLLDAEGNYRGSADVSPDTTQWRTGETYTTIHRFQLDALAAPLSAGSHQLRLAVQDRATGEKIPHTHPSGNEIGDYLDLAPIRIIK